MINKKDSDNDDTCEPHELAGYSQLSAQRNTKTDDVTKEYKKNVC